MSTPETAPSRLSKTNRADKTDGPYEPSTAGPRSVPLTERDGVTLRQEVRDVYSVERNEAATWTHATRRWRDYIDDKSDVKAVFQNEAGLEARGSKPHRFHPDYADKQYAKLKDLERGISDDYGKRLHTAMLTFTASSTDDGDDPLPPVDHLDTLLSSWDALRRALDRALDGRRYERLAILEPHRSGYLHCHMAVFVDGKVRCEDFESVIEAHVRNCPGAEWDAHDLDDDSTISVRHAGTDRDLDSDALDELAIYLAEYLGSYGEDPLEQPEHVQAANALLWATERQRWRPSNGAQQYMKTPEHPDSAGEWSMVGIERDGEIIPCDGDTGGVDRFTTGPVGPPPDSNGAD